MRSSKFRDERGDLLVALGCLVVALAVLAWVTYLVAAYTHVEHRTCHVTGKDRASSGSGSSSMRVYTSDCGNLQVKDATFRRDFHSSDIYAAIAPGHVYDFTTIGFRIPFFSSFPNIVEEREVAAS